MITEGASRKHAVCFGRGAKCSCRGGPHEDRLSVAGRRGRWQWLWWARASCLLRAGSGVVNRIEAFYSWSTGKGRARSAIYVFGTTHLRLGSTSSDFRERKRCYRVRLSTIRIRFVSSPAGAAISTRSAWGLDLLRVLNSLKISSQWLVDGRRCPEVSRS